MSYTVDVLFCGFPAMLGLGGVALIRNESHNILFDTGNGFIRPRMKELLAEKNLKFDDIDTVILSHLHWDHTFNYDFFPHAQYILSDTEWNYANNRMCQDIIVDKAILSFLRSATVRFIKLDGEEIFPGMKAIFTPGHTPGCMSILLEQGDEHWMLVGDAIKTRGELRTGSSGMTCNPEVTRATIDKIKKMADRILPGHDNWIYIRNGEIVPAENEFILHFTEGMTANGGKKSVTIRLD
jgi:glyoxylase-like metal-dependent hydrolase (beta-lactamase superfamily II)